MMELAFIKIPYIVCTLLTRIYFCLLKLSFVEHGIVSEQTTKNVKADKGARAHLRVAICCSYRTRGHAYFEAHLHTQSKRS